MTVFNPSSGLVGTAYALNGLGQTILPLPVIKKIVNGSGLQEVLAATGCTITAGAVGNTCTTSITLPVTLNSTSAVVVCSLGGPTGATVLGPVSVTSTTAVTVASYALSTTATGKGTVNCAIFN